MVISSSVCWVCSIFNERFIINSKNNTKVSQSHTCCLTLQCPQKRRRRDRPYAQDSKKIWQKRFKNESLRCKKKWPTKRTLNWIRAAYHTATMEPSKMQMNHRAASFLIWNCSNCSLKSNSHPAICLTLLVQLSYLIPSKLSFNQSKKEKNRK